MIIPLVMSIKGARQFSNWWKDDTPATRADLPSAQLTILFAALLTGVIQGAVFAMAAYDNGKDIAHVMQ